MQARYLENPAYGVVGNMQGKYLENADLIEQFELVGYVGPGGTFHLLNLAAYKLCYGPH